MPYKMADGRWRAVRMISGKRRTKICRTRKEAKKWEAKQSHIEWNAAPIPTVFCVSTEYLSYCKEQFCGKTYNEKRLAVKNMLAFISPDTPMDSLQVKTIQAALGHRAKASGHSANKDRKNLVAMYQWAVKMYGLPAENPFKKIERFRADPIPRHIPSENEFWAAYNAAGQEDRVFLLAALHTAARRGELFRLAWADIDWEARTIRLGTRKTRDRSMEYAVLPMTSELADALARHKKSSLRSVFVFCREDGQAFASRQHYMDRLCKRAGVKAFGFHAIRHLSASMLARAGVPLPTIQQILRHKSSTTTSRYLHSLGVVENVLEGVFKKKAPEDESGACREAIST